MNKDFSIITFSFVIVSLTMIGISGCSTGNEIITEAKNLCENSEGLVHEAQSNIQSEESVMSLQPSAPALTLRKNTYKIFKSWVRLGLLPDYLQSRTDANTIVCISEGRRAVATYESGAKGYRITWTVQLLGYPDGELFSSKTFESAYDPPKYKAGSSDIYGDPPDEEQVVAWILSILKGKSAIISESRIFDIALSPDGERLVIADGKNLQIWDVATEMLFHKIDEVDSKWIVFSPDGKMLAAGIGEMGRIFDANSYEELQSFEAPDKKFYRPAFSPDSKLLATGDREGVNIWDVSTRQLMQTFLADEERWSGAHRVLFFPDGNTLVGSSEKCIVVWDVASGEKIDSATYCSRWGEIRDIAISSDGSFLAIGWDDGGVLIFDTNTWKIIDAFDNRALSPLPTKVVTFLPGGSILVGNIQDELMIWDVDTFKTLGKVEMDVEKVVAFPDGKQVAILYRDAVRILDVEKLISQ